MKRFVVDAGAVLHVAAGRIRVAAGHKLLAPTLLRSQILSALHETVRRGELSADVVLRRRAWDIADELGWGSTYDAEYLALTQLQADAFVTLDAKLARSARRVVTVASIDELA